MSEFQGRPYFPSLTGLRAIAALVVLFTHVERYRQLTGRDLMMPYANSSFAGSLAVTFFFVLSGFLITSLLLAEKSQRGTIRIGAFLYKRWRRIWPLYYTVLAAGYGVSIFLLKSTPADPLENGVFLNILLLPNIAFAFGLIPDILIQIWSVGTEEQFYLIWPFLVRRSPAKPLAINLCRIIAGALVLRLIVHLVMPGADWLNIILYRTRIDCMASGGLFALLLLHKDRNTRLLRCYQVAIHPFTGWVCMAGFLLAFYLSVRYGVGLYPVYMFLSGILMIRVIVKPVGFLEWAPVKYLGKISYGIYLLHNFAIFSLYGCLPSLTRYFDRSPWGDLGVFVLTVVLTVIAAAISYRWLESPFLRKRNKSSSDSIPS
ncbi:MAG: acyltransferase [Puia sp.]|nr:acyltransferase [Puia sp.]